MLCRCLDRHLTRLLLLDCLVELKGLLAFALLDSAYFKFSLFMVDSVALHEQAQAVGPRIMLLLLAWALCTILQSLLRLRLRLKNLHVGHAGGERNVMAVRRAVVVDDIIGNALNVHAPHICDIVLFAGNLNVAEVALIFNFLLFIVGELLVGGRD